MNGLFWLLLIPAVLTFGLIAWATDRILCAIERAWRRRQVRREMAALATKHINESMDAIYAGASGLSRSLRHRERELEAQAEEAYYDALRRVELEGLATAQDRYARRIR